MHLKKVRGNQYFAAAVIVCERALAIDVRSKVQLVDSSFDASLFPRLARRAFASGKARLYTPLGKRPFAGTGIDEKEFKRRAANPITNGCDLDGKSSCGNLWKCLAGWLSQRSPQITLM